MSESSARERSQDKQTVLAAVRDLSTAALMKARRHPRPEVSAAAERLIARVDRKAARRCVGPGENPQGASY